MFYRCILLVIFWLKVEYLQSNVFVRYMNKSSDNINGGDLPFFYLTGLQGDSK
jgi:hypothetical protein